MQSKISLVKGTFLDPSQTSSSFINIEYSELDTCDDFYEFAGVRTGHYEYTSAIYQYSDSYSNGYSGLYSQQQFLLVEKGNH